MHYDAGSMQGLTRNVVLGVLLGVAVYAALAVYGDVSSVAAGMAAFGWGAFGLALVLAAANYVLRFVKWEIYRRHLGIAIPAGESFAIYLAGFSMSVTPAKLGEVLKSFLMKERYGVPVATSAPMVLADRLTDLIALLLLLAFGTLAFGRGALLLAGGGAIVAAIVVAVGIRGVGERVAGALGRLPILRRRASSIAEMFRSAHTLCRIPNLPAPTALSVAAWFAECVAFHVVVNGFPGVEVGLATSVFVYSAATVAGAIAMVPGGVGIAEGGLTGLLLLLEPTIGPGTAAANTILVRLATLWFAVAVGLAALGWLRARGPARAPM